MLKMKKMKKMLIVVMIMLVIYLLVAMNFETKATSDNPIDLSNNLDIITDTETPTEPNLNIAGNEPINEEAKGPIIQPDTNTLDKLPKTGVTEDITVAFFIVVCVVSAIYAYKKIRDYNV